MVGRDGEWSELVKCLDAAAAGRGGLVAVVGEVGVGKTRLTGDLSDVARVRGMSVLLGRAVDPAAPVPFRALFEALSGYIRRAGADAHPELGRLRSTLAVLGVCQLKGVTGFLCLLPACAEAAVEGDVEGVEGGLPPVGPALAASAGGVQADDDEVEVLEGGLLGGEVAAGLD
jgi:hypothetical protein